MNIKNFIDKFWNDLPPEEKAERVTKIMERKKLDEKKSSDIHNAFDKVFNIPPHKQKGKK